MSDRRRLFMGVIIALLVVIICSGLGTLLIAAMAANAEGY